MYDKMNPVLQIKNKVPSLSATSNESHERTTHNELLYFRLTSEITLQYVPVLHRPDVTNALHAPS